VIRLGGRILEKESSWKDSFLKGILGEQLGGKVAGTIAQTRRRISCRTEQWLAKLFGTDLD
jgi:hypothetical protein